MSVAVTALYTACVALLFLILSARVILYRRANRISLGDVGDKALIKRMRAQANCGEYAPIGLMLLLVSELSGAPALALHLMGMTLLAGRFLHAVGFSATPQKMILRQVGMAMTLAMILFSALGLIGHALF
ncbi:MAPEG family protein [Sulfitobacter sp. G21635-S1]|uniref:MAPEG family protein n=1 Tax=Sulfitobacter sp. G21635-S1 TaxID=3014043 RepID=UPI0022AFD4CB|nr:MAPEG family protein [Sulfitobacter sp. G21635-S1]MCZ4258162.1 MAPEG family protein [Sulfitobacter sp. G21635-S1]